MDLRFFKALLDLLTFYFDSAAEVDRSMVRAILKVMLEVLRK
jgi:hypothetical protein